MLAKFHYCVEVREQYLNMQTDSAQLCFFQTQWRRFHAVSTHNQLKKANLTLQCLWRARVARRELRKLRMVSLNFLVLELQYIPVNKRSIFSLLNILQPLAFTYAILYALKHQMQAARETGALKEAKDKLEKRVEELTWRLEFEKHLRVGSW